MTRTFFLNLLMSFIFVAIGAVVVVVVDLLIIYFVSAALGGWFYVSEKFYFWVSFIISTILSGIMAFYWGGFNSARISDEHLGVCGELKEHWMNNSKKPIKYKQVFLALTPSLLIAAGLIISILVGYNAAIEYLENVENIATDLEECQGYFLDLSVYLSISISAIILFIRYFFMMISGYKNITCQHCKTVGRIEYKFEDSKTTIEYETDTTTSEEKLGDIRSESGRKVDIYGNVTRSSTYEVTKTRSYYVGECRVCGCKCKRAFLSKYDRKQI